MSKFTAPVPSSRGPSPWGRQRGPRRDSATNPWGPTKELPERVVIPSWTEGRPDEDELVLAAMSYGRRGWAVIPLHSIRDEGGCTCRKKEACPSPGKHPRVSGGVWAATTDVNQIARWWIRWPDSNIGVALGAASNLVVVDADNRLGSAIGHEDLIWEGKVLSSTRTTLTGNGMHYIFANPGPCGNGRVAEGMDVKGCGSFVVMPPSVHWSAPYGGSLAMAGYSLALDTKGQFARYQVVNDREPAQAPKWVLDGARKPPPKPPRPSTTGRFSAHGMSLLNQAVAKGQQSDHFMRLACSAVATGVSKDKFLAMAKNPRYPGGAALQARIAERGESRAMAWFNRSVWPSAEAYVKAHSPVADPASARVELSRMLESLPKFTWETAAVPSTKRARIYRVGGPTIRKCLEAVIEIGMEFGTLDPIVSIRDCALAAGIAENAAAGRALRALVKLGWLRRNKWRGPRKATSYHLVVRGSRKNTPRLTELCSPEHKSGRNLRVGHDVFRRGGGIGDVGRRALEVMSVTEPASTSALAGAIGSHPGHLRKVLGQLQKLDLVKKDANGWLLTAVPHTETLDKAASHLPTCGRGARQEEQVRSERAAYKVSKAAGPAEGDEAENLVADPETGEIAALPGGASEVGAGEQPRSAS